MDGLRSGKRCGIEDPVDGQVALACGGRADPDRDIRFPHVTGIGVGVAVDGDGANPHPSQGGDDPDGDLAPVGHENRVEHASHIRKTP
ncbi:hypothetical protein GCM10012275_05080 [Longimycelium tulufanense]|uniref:Uncharacterized protein n=1 Tax=Longimycelium tulufanense TaxID=907463 RepID=A0A8J3FUP2_9PSEU|nr:hypothetical protein GCM10012275_05080 [Longimycelium tulufanense]